MSQLLTDLDRKIGAAVHHDACRSLPEGQGISAALPYHLEALPQPLDQGLLLLWVILHVVNRQAAQIDRLERLVAGMFSTAPDDAMANVLESVGLRVELVAEVRHRREAEAQAAAAAMAKEGAH
jgi:hypothetical protein